MDKSKVSNLLDGQSSPATRTEHLAPGSHETASQRPTLIDVVPVAHVGFGHVGTFGDEQHQ